MTQPRQASDTVLNFIAALIFGALLPANLTLLTFGARGIGGLVADAAFVVALLAVGGVAVLPVLRRWGWIVVAAGTAGLAALYFQNSALAGSELLLAVGVVVGLQLGGVILALAATGPSARWSLLFGIAVGLVAGRYTLSYLVLELRRDLFIHTPHSDDIILATLALALAAIGVVQLLRRTGEGPAADADLAWPWVPIVGAAILARALLDGWQQFLNHYAEASTGGMSSSSVSMIETMDEVAHAVIAVIAAAILAVAAWRRGGPSLVRWVLVAFAAGPMLGISTVNNGYSLTVFRNLVLPALVGVALGAYLVRHNDRNAPWDATGVAGLAVVLSVATPSRLFQSPSIAVVLTMIAAAVVAFTAATGLARLADDGPGLAGGAVGGSAALGFAALVICEPLLAPVMSTGQRLGSGVPTAGVVTLALTAVALLVLHLRGTRVSQTAAVTANTTG